MSKPNHCPNCGAGFVGEFAAVGIYDDRSGDGGYDCSCRSCDWTGDVFPDDEQGRFGKEAGAGSPRSETGGTP